ncbi:hypothetical protein AVEN_187278-1 [Araneus ventricosus]|uniref:Uncharacterized protein n=1 Tax=Araneus ventricosus TaxID=182803 RepID=A0A4Y2GQ60_ARAVE|nr:hypothetical protein AVEN_187278-1 [Araneus ventricosus]
MSLPISLVSSVAETGSLSTSYEELLDVLSGLLHAVEFSMSGAFLEMTNRMDLNRHLLETTFKNMLGIITSYKVTAIAEVSKERMLREPCSLSFLLSLF